MKYKYSERSKIRMRGIDPRLIEVLELAITITKVDFGIPEYGGLRTQDEQHKLFTKGLSKADGLYSKSKHQSGLAFDVFAYVDGRATWDIFYMSQVACAILQAANTLGYKLSWGGLWESFIDTPHFELGE